MSEYEEELKIVKIPDNMSIEELAEFLNRFPEGECKFVIYEFDEKHDSKR